MTQQTADASGPAVSATGTAWSQPGTRQTFAPRKPKVMNLVFSSYLGLFLLAGALVPGVLWWARVLAWLGLAILALLNWRMMRLAVIATSEGLIIRNLRNTHRIAWCDVETIFRHGPIPPEVYRETALPKWKECLFVRLAEGAVISCTIYNDSLYAGGSAYLDLLDGAVAALNELRDRHSARSGPISDVADSPPDLLS